MNGVSTLLCRHVSLSSASAPIGLCRPLGCIVCWNLPNFRRILVGLCRLLRRGPMLIILIPKLTLRLILLQGARRWHRVAG